MKHGTIPHFMELLGLMDEAVDLTHSIDPNTRVEAIKAYRNLRARMDVALETFRERMVQLTTIADAEKKLKELREMIHDHTPVDSTTH